MNLFTRYVYSHGHTVCNGDQHSQLHTSNVISYVCTQKYNQIQIMFEKHCQYFVKLIGDGKSMV